MAYKKFVKRNGKIFGPYYYESYRGKDGKVRKKYVGTTDPSCEDKSKKSNVFRGLMISLILLLGFLILFGGIRGITANVISDVVGEKTVSSYDNGNLSLSIKAPVGLDEKVLSRNKNKRMDFDLGEGNVRLYFDLVNYSGVVENVGDIVESESVGITGNIIRGLTSFVVANESVETVNSTKVMEKVKEKVEELDASDVEEVVDSEVVEVEDFDISIEENETGYKWGYDLKLNDLKMMVKVDVSSTEEISVWDNSTLRVGNSLLSFSDLIAEGYSVRIERPTLSMESNASLNLSVNQTFINETNLTLELNETNFTIGLNETVNESNLTVEEINSSVNVSNETIGGGDYIDEIVNESLDLGNESLVGNETEEIEDSINETDSMINETVDLINETNDVEDSINETVEDYEQENLAEEEIGGDVVGEEDVGEVSQDEEDLVVEENVQDEEVEEVVESEPEVVEEVVEESVEEEESDSGVSITGNVIRGLTGLAIGQADDLEYENSITIYIERDFTNTSYEIGDMVSLDPTLVLLEDMVEGNSSYESNVTVDGNHSHLVIDNSSDVYLNFDGDGDYVGVGAVDHFSNETFTISLWINANVVSDWDYALTGWSTDTSNEIIKIKVQNSYISLENDYGVIRDLTNDAQINTWYHVVGVYNSSSGMKGYLNGVYKGEDTSTIQPPSYLGALNFGRKIGLASYFNGSIDEVRIYNRSLNSSEVSEVYASGRVANSSLPSDGLVSWWAMDEGVGANVADSVGANDGAIVNDVSWSSWGLGDNLVGYWSFDGDDENSEGMTAYDWSGEGNDGAMNGNAVVNSTGGRYGMGAKFDGYQDFINVTDEDFNFSELAISFWAKATTTPASYDSILGKSNPDWTEGFGFYYSLNEVKFWVNQNSLNRVAEDVVVTEWHHYVGVWDGTNMRLYIDTETNSVDTFSGTVSETNPLYIGATIGSADRSWPGYVDEVMIFNTSLTAEQIQAIYNNQSARFKSTGEQKVRAVNIEQNGTVDKVNLTSNVSEEMGSSIEARLGMINSSVNLSGLVLYMPFEWGSAVDISGEGNDGTLNGDVSWNETGGRNETGAFAFDGGGDYVDCGNDDLLDLNDSEITVSIWINAKQNQEGSVGFLISKKLNTAYELLVDADGSLNLNGDVWFRLNSLNVVKTGLGIISVDDWYHIVGTYNKSALRIYVNGDLKVENNSVGLVPIDVNTNLFIGSSPTYSNYDFNGSIDDVMIFNRSLSADEISALYNATSSAHDGVAYYTDYQNLSSGGGGVEFDVSTSADFVFPDYRFVSGNDSFYSPIVFGGLSVEGYSSADVAAPNINEISPSNLTVANPSSINFSANLSDDTGLSNATLYIYNGSGLFDSFFFDIVGSPLSYIASIVVDLTSGTYTWFWEVFDLAGNSLRSDDAESGVGGNYTLTVLGEEEVVNSSFGDTLTNVTFEGNVSGNHSHLTVSDLLPYNSLVGYWSFDGDSENSEGMTAYDWSGSGNDGVGYGNAVVNSSGGRYGRGLVLDGNGDYVNISDSDSLNLTENFTLSLWFRSISDGNLGVFIAKDNIGSSRSYSFFKQADNTLRFIIFNSTGYDFNVVTTQKYESSGWYYAVAVYTAKEEGSSVMEIFVDGTSIKNITNAGLIKSVYTQTTIGKDNNNVLPTRALNGSIDEVMIFNRSLTAEQIQAIYNNQSARFKPTGEQKVRGVNINQTGSVDKVNLTSNVSEEMGSSIEARLGMINSSVNLSGLVMYMPFEWGSAVDISGQGNDGTIVNAVWNSSGGRNETGAFVFDGGNEGAYISISANGITANQGTIALWARPRNLVDNGYIFSHYNVGNRIYLSKFGDGYYVGLGGVSTIDTGIDFASENQWYYLTLEWDGVNYSAYYNGINIKSGSYSGLTTLGTNLWIGGLLSTNPDFNGSIDDVMIFNRSLSAAEISALYNATSQAHDGVPYYTDYQNISSGEASEFNVSTSADFVFPDYRFVSGNDSFYSSVLFSGLSVEGYSSVDVTLPSVIVNSPLEKTYSNSSILFNITTTDNVLVDSCWVSIDNGLTNNSLIRDGASDYFNFTNESIPNGDYAAYFYCNDSSGNLNDSVSVSFSVDTTSPNLTVYSPVDGSSQVDDYVLVNASASDSGNVSMFIDDGSLVSWWRMDDYSGSTLVDYIGLNNGTVNGDASYTADGKMGGAFAFDGDGDYVDLGTLDWNLTDGVTFSFWTYRRNNSAVMRAILFSGFATSYEGAGGSGVGYYLSNGSSFGDNLIWIPMSYGEWHHITMTYNGTDYLLYKNGALVGNKSIDMVPYFSGTGYISSSTASFNGSLDDLMLFNRSLSAEEIVALYANTSAKYVSNNFTSLDVGNKTFSVYSQDTSGNVNSSSSTVSILNISKTGFNNSTDLSGIDLSDVQEFYLEDTDYGKINFSESLIFGRDVDLDSYVNVSFNSIEINSTALPELNKSARLSLYNLTFTNPRVLKDGTLCSDCTKVSYSGGTFVFDVNSFSIYSAEETPVIPSTPTTSSGGGGGGGGGTVEISNNFSVSEDEFSIRSVVGDLRTRKFRVKNTGEGLLGVNLNVLGDSVESNGTLKDFDKVVILNKDSFVLKAGEEMEIEAKIIVPESLGVHVGKIIVEAGGDKKEILVTLNTQSKETLFDISSTPRRDKILKGHPFETQMYLLPVGEKGVDVTIKYLIRDYSGKTYYEESSTFYVDNEISFMKEFDTADLVEGKYVLAAEMTYVGGFATASSQFEIVSSFNIWDFIIQNIYLVSLAIVILLVFLVILIKLIKIRRYKKSKKK